MVYLAHNNFTNDGKTVERRRRKAIGTVNTSANCKETQYRWVVLSLLFSSRQECFTWGMTMFKAWLAPGVWTGVGEGSWAVPP